ncbi:hypothetical protein ASPZODRAFT_153440 [Penicilliopsis zonata CBS 506.65]|uniref:Amino acid permease/ SLC12A domain-containing protein n=1 Tax=Penicilliopsis zonata CBS 506.65 TaxID=1073090 RepID=A0A1L9SDF0_9EURO|nr:hypothetical protein ASPZODRAFT_153440 [Penicilliopsis zonata CBS 506.65]OJJ45168.1 hypothetical protein ASPZODRAFT_153440 [Penicilliopsis zonata CBS 506.65]
MTVSKVRDAAKADADEKGPDPAPGMGDIEELPRNFGLLSVFAIGYSICAAPCALLLSLGVIIGSGGQAVLLWGQLLVYFVSLCIAASLAELASAYPNAGGQYYWAAVLAPKSCRRLPAFIVGHLSWASAVCACASMLVALAEMGIAMFSLRHPDAATPTWVTFLVYQLINIVMFGLNCWESLLPRLSRIWLTISMATALIIFITILARTNDKRSASFVFTGFTNLTGWSDGIAFLTGLLGVNWGLSCLDAVTHMAEEIPDPRRNIPKALIGTVVVNALLAWPMAIAIAFCIQNIEQLFAPPTGLASLSLFLQVFKGSTAAPLALQALLFLGGLGAVFGIHTWQARLAWTVARDGGLPFAKYTKSIAPAPYGVPFWAHVYSSIFAALLGCLYLGSSAAFNAFVGSLILMQYLCYSICIVFALWRGRDNIPRGPFWLGKYGLVCNIVTLAWTAFALVFYSFPPYNPVTAMSMNYASVVTVGFAVLIAAFYLLFGHKRFASPAQIDE